MKNNKRTYISLFSSAGVGCFGFKLENFECVATSELIESRINIQKSNNKCKYDSGYICGDIKTDEVKEKIFNEIKFWKDNEKIENIDVVVATPPCQGMSTANYKKNNEQKRNSLVVEAIKIINDINPKVFIFENVRAFIKTICTDIDGNDKEIGEAIKHNLEEKYNIFYKIINFKNYGVPSSRPRTIVIGTRKDLKNISPLNLFPFIEKEITLREAIGDLSSLQNFDELDKNDIYHSFRKYDSYMREWIVPLKEGQSAFNNPDELKPYKIIDGAKVLLKSGHLGNKFRRLFWNKPCACVATRNDQLASQDTIHPSDDRVLSIRELMRVMTIPESFKWSTTDLNTLTTTFKKKEYLRKNELNIRRCIGEAVPTKIMQKIAKNINDMLDYEEFIEGEVNVKTVDKDNYYISSYLLEESLSDNKETGSFYTSQAIIYDCLKNLEIGKAKKIKILEPSVGGGNFILPLINVIDNVDKIELHLVDINEKAINHLKKQLKKYNFDSKRICIKYYIEDFIKFNMADDYDIVIGNPPYFKLKSAELNEYKKYVDITAGNIYGLFLDKIYPRSNKIIMVIPKNFLMAPGFNLIREKYENYNIISLFDYGVKGFKKVFIEIISIHFDKNYKGKVYVENKRDNTFNYVPQKYIFHDKMWLIYRNDFFDNYIKNFELDYFDCYRDRQITNKYLKKMGRYKVLRSKNLLDDGRIISIKNYDRYVDSFDNFVCSKYMNKDALIFPNFTYNIRAAIFPKDTLTNGSIVIAIPKNNDNISDINITVYSTPEFREYYSIVKNKSRFTINIDKNTIYYIGKLKEDSYV